MTTSLFNGISGLNTYQKMLDVISDNVANINTPGHKRSTFRAVENFGQTLREAFSAADGTRSVDPIQIGGGAKVGTVFSDFSQGALDQTNRTLDLAIQGEGFFILNDGQGDFFTRVGSFAFDKDNNLVDQITGFRVQSINGDIQIDQNQTIPPQVTSEARFQGNLSTEVPVGSTFTTSTSVIDLQGASHSVDLTFTRVNANEWDLTASLPDGDGVLNDATVAGITFNENGSFAGAADDAISITFNGLTTPQDITFDFGSAGNFDGLTQLAGNSSAVVTEQDGFPSGTLQEISVVGLDGTILGRFSNGLTRSLGQVSLATFANPEGLEKADGNLYSASVSSGDPVIGAGQAGRAGAVISGSIETSNVDTSKEIALMIIAQRGFQVNARSVTTSNQLLEEISNLIR